MRIGINTRFLLSHGMEGLGLYTQEIAKRLVANHPEHEFFFYFDRPYDEKFIFGKNVQPRVVYPPARHPVLWKIWFDFTLPMRLKKDKLDLFFSPDGFASLNYPGRQMMVIHDLGFEHYPEHVPPKVRKFYQEKTPRYARKCEHVFTVSGSTLNDVHLRYGIEKEKMSVAYNGVRPEFGPVQGNDVPDFIEKMAQGSPYFLFVGAMHPRKNIARLLQAFDHFKSNNSNKHKLFLTGRKAWMTSEIELIYDKMKYAEDVVFLGYLEINDLAQVTAHAHLCVYPSLFEGFGVPLLEAMTCGVPILTSNVSCMPEIVGEAAVLVDPNSAESISNGMQQLVDDRELYTTLRKKGFEQAKLFSWDRTAKHIGERMGLPLPESRSIS